MINFQHFVIMISIRKKCNDLNLNKYDENFIGNQNEYFEENEIPINIDQFLPPTVTK